MHEQAIAAKIISDAERHGEVESLVVEVGDLAHLPAEEMREVLEKMTDWEVEVVSCAAVVKCECGYEGAPKILHRGHDNNVYECLKCGRMFPEIVSGGGILLREVVLVSN